MRIGHQGVKEKTNICHLDIARDLTNHVISMALSSALGSCKVETDDLAGSSPTKPGHCRCVEFEGMLHTFPVILIT